MSPTWSSSGYVAPPWPTRLRPTRLSAGPWPDCTGSGWRRSGRSTACRSRSRSTPTRCSRRCRQRGELGSAQAAWLAAWFDALAAHGTVRAENVLLHGDILPANIVADESGQVTALLDWGCAEWGDPVRDFVDLPTRALPALLDGYLAATGKQDERQDWAAGAVWYQLFWALAKLRKTPSTSEARNWSAPRQARFVELLRFFASPLPSPWSDLAPTA